MGALPALRDLRAGHPDARITVAVNEYVRGALEGCPYVDGVLHPFTYGRRGRLGRASRRAAFLAAAAGGFDITIGLRFCPPGALLAGWASRSRTRIGYHQQGWAARLLTDDLGPEPRSGSNRVANLAALKLLGIPCSPRYPELSWVERPARAELDRVLGEAGIAPGDGLATLQTASHWGCNEWRGDKWAALADHLSERWGLRVLVSGTGETFEAEKLAEIGRLSRHPIVPLLGRTTIPMLFDLVARSRLVVAADSAMTQVALAQRTPSVILFGIEAVDPNGPLPEEVREGLTIPLQHWPGGALAPAPNPHCRFREGACHSSSCRENSSLAQITPEEACEAADRLLERASAAPQEGAAPGALSR